MRSQQVLAGLVLGLGSLLFMVTPRSYAQEADSAIVVGNVLDSTQAAVADASVTLTHLGTNATTVVHTNERGEYRTPALRLGEYEISVEAPGFKRFDQRGVALDIGDVREVDETMVVGEVSQLVTVNAAPPCCRRRTRRSGRWSRTGKSWSCR